MTTTLFLVRHGTHGVLGQVLCGRMPGVGLAAAGVEEAKAVARTMAARGVAAVYTSPRDRTLQTATLIGDATGVVPRPDEALDEIDFGTWTGRTFAQLHGDPAWEHWNQRRSQHRPPEGESMMAVQARVARWLADAIMRHEGARVVAVSHADVIKAALCHALGLPLDQHDRFAVDPGSISTIVGGNWGMRVHGMNERPV